MKLTILSEYQNYEYRINLYPLNDEDGNGWFAEIAELKGCMADGETKEEALKNLEEAKNMWLKTAIKRGQVIPKPISDNEENYSGKFTLRIPKSLHRELVNMSKQEDISLNQYIVSLLSYNFGKDVAKKNEAMIQQVSIYQQETTVNTDMKKRFELQIDEDIKDDIWPMLGQRR